MLRRAWLLICLLWGGLMLYNGSTRTGGITDLDVFLAVAPLLIGFLLRFVATGSFARR